MPALPGLVSGGGASSSAASVAALGNGGGGAEAWAPGRRGSEEQGQGQGGRCVGAEVEARAASARFAELPTVRPETQDEIDLGIDGMAIAVATGFEFEAFWAQAAVLYNEKAMAAMERSAEDGSTPKAYRGPTTADQLEAWFEQVLAKASAKSGGGAPSQNPPQLGVGGRGAEDGPATNALRLVSAESMKAWWDSVSTEPAANQHGVLPQVRR